MPAPTLKSAELIATLEPSRISCRDTAALALTVVRDGVITGEGPTTRGRVHFSRALDADDAAWCARILTATAVEHEPVSRPEAEARFEINDAAARGKPHGPARKPRHVEIALRQHALVLHDRLQPIRGGLGDDLSVSRLRGDPVGQGFGHYPADQSAFGHGVQTHQLGNRHADIGIADRQWIDITGFKI